MSSDGSKIQEFSDGNNSSSRCQETNNDDKWVLSFVKDMSIDDVIKSSKATDFKNVKRRSIPRNRKRRSCNFCHVKHLKCNRVRPKCNVCTERNYEDCTYYDSTLTAEASSVSKVHKTIKTQTSDNNAEGTLKIKTLNKKHKRPSKKVLKPSIAAQVDLENLLQASDAERDATIRQLYMPNPILIHPTSTYKDGRILFFGPTCFRSAISIVEKQETPLKRIFNTWRIFHKQKDTLSTNKPFSLAREAHIINYEVYEDTLLQDVLKVIPETKGEIKDLLELFFSSALSNSVKLLSKESVLRYVDEIFITEKSKISKEDNFYNSETNFKPQLSENSDHYKITSICHTNKCNYYKAGIVVFILGLSLFDANFPDCILSFFIFLQGQSTGKMMYLEKVQFLVLKCFFSFTIGLTGYDFSHIVNLVGIMCNCMVEFHLNDFDVVQLYQQDENLRDSAGIFGNDFRMLNRIFIIGLLVDVICSFEKGKPLFITSDMYCDEWLLLKEKPDLYNDQRQCDILNDLKVFLFHSRKLLKELFKPTGVPKINGLLNNMMDFIHKDLKLNEYCYADRIPNTKIELGFSIIKLFLTSFALEAVISVLGIKSHYRFSDSTEKADDSDYYLLNDNQIVYYCLSVYQVAACFIKCFNKRQAIYQTELAMFDPDNSSGIKKPEFDKLLIFLSLSPSFYTTLRIFAEFSQVLFYAKLLVPDMEYNEDYINQLLKDDKKMIYNHFDGVDLPMERSVSVDLREFVSNTDVMEDIRRKESGDCKKPQYLAKLYSNFHPEMFQRGDLNKNLLKMKFTGLQLYGWFTKLYDDQSFLDAALKKNVIQFKLNVRFLKAKEKFIRTCFTTFLERLKEQKEKDGLPLQAAQNDETMLTNPINSKESDVDFSAFQKGESASVELSPCVVASNIADENFNYMQKITSVDNNPLNETLDGSNDFNPLSDLPLFHWDMNFVDFSSKMNWFTGPSEPVLDDANSELNLLDFDTPENKIKGQNNKKDEFMES